MRSELGLWPAKTSLGSGEHLDHSAVGNQTRSQLTGVSRILIVHGGAIGDFILALPAIGALRRSFPDATIELIGNSLTHQLAQGRMYADKVSSIEGVPLHTLFTADPHEDIQKTLSSFDLVVSWFGATDEHYPANLRKFVDHAIVAPSFPPPDANIHVTDHLLTTLSPLGLSTADRMPRVYPSEEDRAAAGHRMRNLGLRSRRVIAIHPGSGSARKRWPAAKFAELAASLIAGGTAVLVLEGPADRNAVDEIFSLLDPGSGPDIQQTLVHVTQLSLSEVAALLQQCRCYIGNDSGITHLSAAVGTPTVAIFLVTDPVIWGPLGKHVSILQNPLSVMEVVRAAHGVSPADLQHRLNTHSP